MAEQTSPADDPYIIARAARGRWRKLRDVLSKFFFGDDIFISYARADAAEYAASLAASLTKRRFICYLDQFGSKPEAEMPDDLKEKLMRSTSVVLVGTPRAAASPNVRKEIELFTRTRRAVIPVDVDRVLLADAGWKELVGLAKIHEAGERVSAGDPSPRIVNLIEDSFKYRRRNQWQRIFLFAGSSFVTLTVLAAVLVSNLLIASAQAQADLIQREAERQVRKANEDADLAARNESLAKADAARYGEQADNAQIEAEGARQAKDLAVEQQELAEAAMLRAQELERLANESAAHAARLEAGASASVLARTPGGDFAALVRAADAAGPELKLSAQPPEPIVKGLVASVLAADDGMRLRDTHGSVTYTQISPDGRKVFAETYEGGVVGWGVWDARTGARLMSLQTPPVQNVMNSMVLPTSALTMPEQKISKATFSGDGGRLAVIDKDMKLSVWDVREPPAGPDAGREEPALRGFANVKNVFAAGFNADGGRLAILSNVPVGGGDKRSIDVLKVVDTAKAVEAGDAEAAVLEPFDLSNVVRAYEVELAGFSRDGEPMLCFKTYQPPRRVLYFPRTGDYRELKVANTRVIGLSDNGLPIFKRDPRHDEQQGFAQLRADAPQSIFQWEGERPWEFKGYGGGAISSAAVVGGRAYVVKIDGGQARVHGARAYEGFATLRGHIGAITHAALSPDGRRAVVAGGEALLWDALNVGPPRRLAFSAQTPGNLRASAAAFSADGRRLVMMNEDIPFPQVWDIPPGAGAQPANITPLCERVARLAGPNPKSKMDMYMTYLNQPKGVAFLPGRQRFVAMQTDGYVGVSEAGKCGFEAHRLGEDSKVVALSADGTTALTVGVAYGTDNELETKDSPVSAWDLSALRDAGGRAVKLEGGDLGALPSGKLLAAHVRGREARVLILKPGRQLELWRSGLPTLKLGSAEGEVYSAVFSSDGGRLATLSRAFSDNGVGAEVWDTATGRRVILIPGEFQGPSGMTGSPIALSGDGSGLLVGHADYTVRIYPTTPRGFLDVANRILKQ